MSLFGLRSHMSTLQRLLLIRGVFIHEARNPGLGVRWARLGQEFHCFCFSCFHLSKDYIGSEQGFSTSVVWTLQPREFCVAGGCLPCVSSSVAPGFLPPTRCQQHPPLPMPSCDNQKCLQTLSNDVKISPT